LVSAISQSSPAGTGLLRHLRGFDFRICQMRMQVSTNRGGWQMQGKSSVKTESQGNFPGKAPFRLGFGPLRA
jgi:hypothetical protein